MSNKLSVKVTDEFNDTINSLASSLTSGNRSELFRRAIKLLELYEKEKALDPSIELGLVKDNKVNARIIF